MLRLLLFLVIKFTHEVGFRMLSIVFYPIAYLMRWKIRDELYSNYKDFFEEICFTDNKTIPSPYKVFTVKQKLYWLLWLFLDDSPAKDAWTEKREDNYNYSDTWDSVLDTQYYPFKFMVKSTFIRAYWWSNIRNSHVNYFSWIITGGWTKDITTLTGTYNKMIGNWWAKEIDSEEWFLQKKRGFYIIDVVHKDGSKNIFLHYSGKILTIQLGKDSGSGREAASFKAT